MFTRKVAILIFLKNNLSKYVDEWFAKHSYTEIVAECFSAQFDNNRAATEIINMLRGDGR